MSFTWDFKRINSNSGNRSQILVPGKKIEVAVKVSDVWTNGNKVFIETGMSNLYKGTIELTFYEDDIVNLKYYKYKIKNRIDYITKNLTEVKPSFKRRGGEIELASKNFVMTIEEKPFNLTIKRKGKRVLSLHTRKGYHFFGGFLAPHLGFEQIGDSHIFHPYITIEMENGEQIYGQGAKYNSFARRGTSSVTISQSTNINSITDTSYYSVPFFVSTNNYGFLLNSGTKSIFEVGTYVENALTVQPMEETLDIFLFISKSIKDVVQKYTKVTGRIKNIPEKFYGVGLSRLYYNNKEEVYHEVNQARKHKFPLDWVGIDPKWLLDRHCKSCNFNWNTPAFGDREEFFKGLKEQDIDAMLWINPNIQGDNSEFFQECLREGYLVKNKNGSLEHCEVGPAMYQTASYPFDFTNPKAKEAWKNRLKDLFASGCRFATIDYGGSLSEDAILYNGKLGKEMKNYYQHIYVVAAKEAGEEFFGEGNTAMYRRQGFIGSQSCGALWGGDSYASFAELKAQISSALSASMTGEAIWGMDLGGGYNGVTTNELTIRWNQAGSLMPMTRFHGIGKKEPWYSSDKRVTEITKKLLELKRRLIIYYKIFELEAVQKGTPVVRPLVMEYQEDRIIRNLGEAYLIGDSILVSPVLEAGQKEKQIYFPLGSKWVDFFDKKKIYDGGRNCIISTPMEKLPVFVKAGSIIPVLPNISFSMNKIPLERVELSLYLVENKKGVLKFKVENKLKKLTYEILNNKVVKKEVV